MHPTHATASPEVITLDGSASQHLCVRTAAPGILLVRRTYDADGRCIEFARDTYRADRAAFKFKFDAQIPPRNKTVARNPADRAVACVWTSPSPSRPLLGSR